MKIYELQIKTYLLRNLTVEESQYQLSKFITEYLAKDEKYLELHKSKKYKPYCFDNLFPINNGYEKENIYNFRIRTIDQDLCNYFLKNFENARNDYFKNLTLRARIIPKHSIDKIFSLSPVVIKTANGYWNNEISLNEFEKRIKDNIFKKYKYFVEEEIAEEDFYSNLKILNNKPVKVYCKGITLLGDKLELQINPDNLSQDIAYLILGVGLGENISYGSGFCGYKYLG
ncbi:CRISPR-associated endoribonuclease Cas6 [Peptoniphilus sp. MSJ-1]|uniref:CRISPR-associated endoribonuclease Cas6 n=1 Tax=Peptoniphilus ovalis TaxID=2841503 RepID=A0ABS6FGP8_9FIRM|nr:CRISPR-associated endoribonuclease Cas6 [Peptoniphilus ovalis]MBU5668431.1 CRISPR-associated endoribonuclease Cas6 [Peptoniphilus ovalis]